jgi:iron complex outermembrane recepter protein
MSPVKTLFCALLCSASPFVYAADAAQPADTIIITSRGRSENARRVPDSISVLRTELGLRKLDTLEAIVSATPGVYFISDTDPGTNLISIRGVSTNRGQAPSVSIVIDGRVVPDSELYTLKPFDVAQVEILKGPQGALYGRSAAGGVIAIQNIQPDETAGYARIGYGNGSAKTFEAAASLPLGEKSALRLATSLADDTGFIRNTTLNKKVDAVQSLNFRGIFTVTPNEAINVTAQASFVHEKGGAAFVSSNNVTQRFGGRLDGAALTNPIGDFEGKFDRDWLGAQANAVYTLPSEAKISALVAYDNYKKNFAEELDFRPEKNLTFFGFPAFPNGIQPIFQPVKISALTGELRYTSPDNATVRFEGGAFIQSVNKRRVDDFIGFGTFATEQNKTTAVGIYGQVAVDITDALAASLALRYDSEAHTQTIRDRANVLQSNRTGTFAAVQPKFTLGYKINPDVFMYASLSSGFKPGGFNPQSQLAPTTPAAFASEKTYGGELGLKASFGPAHIQVAGFITRHDNFQNTVFLDNNLVFSIPRVNIAGIEASGDVQLGNGFTLDGGITLTRARLGAYAVANPTIEQPEPVAKCRFNGNRLCQFGGNTIPASPSYTAQIGVAWQGDISDHTFVARLDYRRTGKVFYEVDNVLYSPDYGSLDARLAVSIGHFEASIWGKNITNSRRALAAFGQQNLLLLNALGPNGPFDSFTINKGRTFGGTISIKF